MGYESVVILPEEMSAERFEKIAAYGARAIKTPGCESNVKEIYDECKRLAAEPRRRRHEPVRRDGELPLALRTSRARPRPRPSRRSAPAGPRPSSRRWARRARSRRATRSRRASGRASSASSRSSARRSRGTATAGTRSRGSATSTSRGSTTSANMDAVMCDRRPGVPARPPARRRARRARLPRRRRAGSARPRAALSTLLGVSGVCNILGAIRTARWLGLGKDDAVVTVATDGLDRYPSVLRRLEKTDGAAHAREGARRISRRSSTARSSTGSPKAPSRTASAGTT